jgi:hypothetical protein
MFALLPRAVRTIVSSRRRRRALAAAVVALLVVAMPVVNAACAPDEASHHRVAVLDAPVVVDHDDETAHHDPCCETVGPHIVESVKPVAGADALFSPRIAPIAIRVLASVNARADNRSGFPHHPSLPPPEPILRRVPRLLI